MVFKYEDIKLDKMEENLPSWYISEKDFAILGCVAN